MIKSSFLISIILLLAATQLSAASLGWLVRGDLGVDPETGDLLLAESGIELKLDHAFGAQAAFSGRLRLSWRAPLSDPAVRASGAGEVLPELRDAWFDLFGFLAPSLELRVGKQRLNYGKSDFFRHLDLVNPPDFSDPLRFDNRVPSWLVRLKWSIGFDTAVELFVGPGIEQPLYGQGQNGMNEQLPQVDALLGGGYSLQAESDLPDVGVKSGVAGVRMATKVLGWDLSLLGVTRLSPVPMLASVVATSSNGSGRAVYSEEREWYLGVALAGDILGLGARGELLFRYHPGLVAALAIDGTNAGRVPVIDRGWDVFWSAGLEYQFAAGGPLIGLEFSRGFMGEYSGAGGGINHYLALSLEQKWGADRWVFAFSLGFEFDRLGNAGSWEVFRKSTAWFTGPELQHTIGDGLKISLGLFYTHAPAGTTMAGGFSTMGYLRFEGKM